MSCGLWGWVVGVALGGLVLEATFDFSLSSWVQSRI